MYNKYLPSDREAFDDLYESVREQRAELPETKPMQKPPQKDKFDLRRLLHGLNIEEMGIIPIVLLLLLIMDVDDEERLIIIALAFIFGI